MKKLLVLVLLLLAVGLGFAVSKFSPGHSSIESPKPKKAVLRVALVADSHNNNDLLAKALSRAKGMSVNFVIGLGDYTNVGTLDELNAAKNVFDASGLTYYVTAGDHDLWDGRNQQIERSATESADIGAALDNFREVFGESAQTFEQNIQCHAVLVECNSTAGLKIRFVILDNSDIYKGIDENGWSLISSLPKREVDPRRVDIEDRPPIFVMAHKTPYHPQSAHIMGETTPEVANQADRLVKLIEQRKIDGFFSGDMHFFANFNSPNGSVKMTTIGAVTREPNPQGPRFGVLTVFDDYSWTIDDVEIR